jgi:hypothetical protein
MATWEQIKRAVDASTSSRDLDKMVQAYCKQRGNVNFSQVWGWISDYYNRQKKRAAKDEACNADLRTKYGPENWPQDCPHRTLLRNRLFDVENEPDVNEFIKWATEKEHEKMRTPVKTTDNPYKPDTPEHGLFTRYQHHSLMAQGAADGVTTAEANLKKAIRKQERFAKALRAVLNVDVLPAPITVVRDDVDEDSDD